MQDNLIKNCYFTLNSPLIWKDPSGLKSEKERGDKMLAFEIDFDIIAIANDFCEIIGNVLGLKEKGCTCWAMLPCGCTGGAGDGPGVQQETPQWMIDAAEESLGAFDEDLMNWNKEFSAPSDKLLSQKDNIEGKTPESSSAESYGRLGTFGNIVANWSSLSANQALAVRNALQIIYDNGGACLLNGLAGKSFKLIFLPGATIADIYNKRNSKNEPFFLGLTMADKVCGNSCSKPTGIFPWEDELPIIMIASEVLEDPTNDKLIYWARRNNPKWWQQNKPYQKHANLWLILSHEIVHFSDSYLPCKMLIGFPEPRAYLFQGFIYNNVFKHETLFSF